MNINSNELIAEMRKTLGDQKAFFGDLNKASVQLSTGLLNYDLQAPAKNLYPVNTPLRNVIPRVKGNGGDSTHWKSVYGIGSSGYGGMQWVPEGTRAPVMSVSSADQFALYTTFGQEISLTFEAWSGALGFEDEKSRNAIRLLQQTMLTEEVAIYGGNRDLKLGTPTTPTAQIANTGGTIGAGTYLVSVVLLTAEGFRNWQQSGASLVTGIPTTITAQPAGGGSTYTVFGGSSAASLALGSLVITGTGVIDVQATPKLGAVAYAWFVGTAGNQRLQAVTTTSSTTFTVLNTTTSQNVTAITADHSYNDGTGGSSVSAFNGLLYSAFISAGLTTPSSTYLPGAYVKMLGGKLTPSGSGTIVEIDNMLVSMWNGYQVSPSVIYVNAEQLKDITTGVFKGSSNASLLNYFTDPKTGYAEMMAGGVIGFYWNPFAMNGGVKIPIKIHPFLPPGTILGWAENLPMQYQSPEVPNVAELRQRRDYYEIDWPLVTRQFVQGVYCEETLAVYAPFAMGVITDIFPGLNAAE